jgi:hypothetical protein
MDRMDKAEEIRLKSGEQFEWLLSHLVTEIHRAWDHWDLCGGLDKAIAEDGTPFNQSAQFWRLTIQAHKDSVVLRLGRLYDPHPKALSLKTFLHTIREDAQRGSRFTKVGIASLDLGALKMDLETVSPTDPLVSRLLEIRDEYLAHRASHIVGSGSVSALPTLKQHDIRTLLERASHIADAYSQLCGRPLTLRGYPGLDDYKHMLDLIRRGLASIEREHADEIRRLQELGFLKETPE